MGTKSNPSNFDCYANADPDEPMFVLLGRDKHARRSFGFGRCCANWMAKTRRKSKSHAIAV